MKLMFNYFVSICRIIFGSIYTTGGQTGFPLLYYQSGHQRQHLQRRFYFHLTLRARILRNLLCSLFILVDKKKTELKLTKASCSKVVCKSHME